MRRRVRIDVPRQVIKVVRRLGDTEALTVETKDVIVEREKGRETEAEETVQDDLPF